MFDNLPPQDGDVKSPPIEDGRPGATVVTNSEPTSDPDQSIAFLQALDPTGRHNLVAIHPESEVVVGHTFEPSAWDGMRDWIASRAGQWNVYFSANEPRPDAPHKKLAKGDIAALRFLYADVDPSKDANFIQERRRLEALDLSIARGMMPASFNIDTGNGRQFLWRLAEKLPVDETAMAWAESYGRGLAVDHGGDNVQNIERLCRLPGTINLPDARKRARGRVAAPARLVRTGSHAYDRAAVEKLVVPAAPSSRQHDDDALVAAAAEAIRGEDLTVTAELREKFNEALARARLLAALWKGDPAALPGKDASGSGWRAALARRMAENHFSALDYARMVHVWTPPGIDLGELTERNLSRDWGRCAARYSTSEIANQHYEKSADAKPADGASDKSKAALTFDDLDGLTLITAEELSDIPDREFILGSRMQPGLLTIGVGPPGASKSTFAILSALAIASGKPLTGEYVAKSGPVLVYTAEDPRAEMLRRYSAVAHRHGLDVDAMLKRVRILSGYDGRRLVFAERRERNGPIRPGPDVEVLADFVRERGIVHVALDPLISLHRGLDENSSSDMEALGDILRDFAKRSGASVDLIHHTVKNRTGQAEQNAGVADSSRGSGAVIGFVRSAYTLTPMGDSTGQALGLPRERSTQMVRLDDAKRNYGRRAARERWFELISVLPSGAEVAALDFEATDPAVVRRALSSVGVHVIFDANRQRALQNLAKGDDDAGRAATLRSYIVSSMDADWIERPVLAGMMSVEMKMGETTARKTIDDLVPAQRNKAVPVEASGLIYDVWREKRKIGSQWPWVVCRQLTGQVVRDELFAEPEDEALEGAFG